MDSRRLPTDVLSEIFSRTSLDTVAKSRILSRACNSATFESNFSRNFTERTNTVSGFFVQNFGFGRFSSSFISPNDSGAGAIDLRFLPCKEIQIIAAAGKQGLLLCENMAPRRRYIPEYYVCKPTTRQWEHIPNPKTRFFTKAVAMVALGSNPLRYKIVRFSRPKDSVRRYGAQLYSTLHCEVFDSATWGWRKFEDDVRLPYCEGFAGRNVPAVSAGGVLHWLMWSRRVFAFHAAEERWAILDAPFPPCSKACYSDARLAEYCGRLGMICQGEDFSELWVMEDRAANVWSKRERVRSIHGTPLMFFGSDVLLAQGHCDLICHNLTNGSAKEFDLRCMMPGNGGIFPFQSDFERVKDQKNTSVGGGCLLQTLFLLPLFLLLLLSLSLSLFFGSTTGD